MTTTQNSTSTTCRGVVRRNRIACPCQCSTYLPGRTVAGYTECDTCGHVAGTHVSAAPTSPGARPVTPKARRAA